MHSTHGARGVAASRLAAACVAAAGWLAGPVSAAPAEASRAAPIARPACPGEGQGKLLLHGGGGGDALYIQRAVELCGGWGVRVLIVPFAAFGPYAPRAARAAPVPSRHAAREPSRSRAASQPASAPDRADLQDWTSVGARTVSRLDAAALADLPAAVATIGAADYIFFGGGDQATLAEWMARYPAVWSAIARRHAEGALLGSSSAGASAMSRRMIVGAETASLTTLRSGGTRLAEGLGFWPEAIVDQHFVRRQRWARLLSAVMDQPTLLGVALDEGTAILVGPRFFEVSGEGTVVVMDARQAQVGPAEAGQPQAARQMALSVLRAGDRFEWRAGHRP